MLVQYILAALAGIIVGGILNVLADDLPEYRWPRLPRYPDDTPRPPIAWLGLTAFLFGKRESDAEAKRKRDAAEGEKRKPDFGDAKLSWRYPLTEIGTAAAFIILLLSVAHNPGMTPQQLAFWFVYVAIFVLVIVIDVEHKLILFSVMIPAGLIAVLDAALTPITYYGPTLQNALVGGGMAFILSFLLYMGGALFIRISGRMRGHSVDEVAFGYGDVMLFTLSGLLLGPIPFLFSLYVTVIAGAIGALLFLVTRSLRKRGYVLFTAIPYGPYIVIGTAAMMLFPNTVLSFFRISTPLM